MFQNYTKLNVVCTKCWHTLGKLTIGDYSTVGDIDYKYIRFRRDSVSCSQCGSTTEAIEFIDRDIAPIICLLNKWGVETKHSSGGCYSDAEDYFTDTYVGLTKQSAKLMAAIIDESDIDLNWKVTVYKVKRHKVYRLEPCGEYEITDADKCDHNTYQVWKDKVLGELLEFLKKELCSPE